MMGKIARSYCHKIIITDDNPRNEDPKKIRKSILKGCGKLAIEIGNRKKAIETAMDELKSREILLVAGKGNENRQDYGKKIIKFSDRQEIKKIIKKRKFFSKKKYYENYLLKKVFNNNKINKIQYTGVSINTKTMKRNNLFFV